VLLQVTAVEDGGPTDALQDDSRQIEALASVSGADIVDQMVATLQAAYGVTINQTLGETAIAQR